MVNKWREITFTKVHLSNVHNITSPFTINDVSFLERFTIIRDV